MNLKNLPLTGLKAFEAVGRHASVRRAAEEMHVSHSALSRHIRQLESRLGISLFAREGNRLQLTAAGQRLLTVVQQAFGQLSEGILYLDPDNMQGEVVIAATMTISTSWLLQLLQRFQDKYPEVQIRLVNIEPRQQVLPQEFDLAICLGKPEETSRQIYPLYEEHYRPVVNPKLTASGQLDSPAALLDYPLLHDSLNQWGQWFTSQGLDVSHASRNCYFDYAFQTIEAARLGMGVALADAVEVKGDIEAGRLIMATSHAVSLGESVYMVTGGPDQQSIRARLLMNAILDWLDEMGTLSETAQALRTDKGQDTTNT